MLESVLGPIRSFRPAYAPLIMVYFAYGALGLIDVSRDLWVKENLTLTPGDLAAVSVWLTIPWTIKMVFGELVDCVPIMGSQRKAYIVIGAIFTAAGFLTLARAAGDADKLFQLSQLYMFGSLLIVIGTVIQDVVADAMSTEVVARTTSAGKSRPDADVRSELGMVQVLGRLSLTAGIMAVAGMSGVLAGWFSYRTVFLIALVIPLISITAIALIGNERARPRPIDWRIFGGGLAFGAIVIALILAKVPYSQEIIFLISMGVVCAMLAFVTRELDRKTRAAIFYTAIIIFAFRATPLVGDGYFWWTIDILKFDAHFYGVLRQTGALLAIACMWLFSKPLTEFSVAWTLFWLAIIGTLLALPNVGLVFGLHEWTEAHFGFGANSIAIVDTAASSPFAQLSMIPMLTLIAFYAPAGQRATWFALMASFMNLALTAGQLQTKYLNEIFVVQRGDYSQLGALLIVVTIISFVVPVGAILLFGGKISRSGV